MKTTRTDQSKKQQGGYVYEPTESTDKKQTGQQSESKPKKSKRKSLCEKLRDCCLRKRQDSDEKSSLEQRQDSDEKSSLEQKISRLFDEVKELGCRMGTMQAEMERLCMLGEMQQKETERLRDMIERGQRDAQSAQRSGDLLQPHNPETQKDLERENADLQQGNDELKRYIDKLKKINDELKQKLKEANDSAQRSGDLLQPHNPETQKDLERENADLQQGNDELKRYIDKLKKINDELNQKLKEANGGDRGYPIESYLPTIKEEIESALSLKCNPEKGEWYFLKIRETVETIAKMIRMYEDQRRR